MNFAEFHKYSFFKKSDNSQFRILGMLFAYFRREINIVNGLYGKTQPDSFLIELQAINDVLMLESILPYYQEMPKGNRINSK